ncbi:MAG TPA: YoaK family protein, partial [Streptosporangiaceae bacterium]
MATLARDIRDTFVPDPAGRHGPLPPLLVGLTLVTGLVDSFSYLLLGHVFVANMTGNVVFLPFDLGGASGFVWWTSVLAIAAFSLGALAGGRIARAAGSHRGRHLLAA